MELATKLLAKSTPSLAMRSILGVWMNRLSYALIVCNEWSSVIIKTIFSGFLFSAFCLAWQAEEVAARAVTPASRMACFFSMIELICVFLFRKGIIFDTKFSLTTLLTFYEFVFILYKFVFFRCKFCLQPKFCMFV